MRLAISNVHVGMTLLTSVSSLEAGIRLTNEHLRLLRFLKVDAIEVAPVERRPFTHEEERDLCEKILQYERHYNQWEERISPNPYEALEFIHQLFRQDYPLSAIVTFFGGFVDHFVGIFNLFFEFGVYYSLLFQCPLPYCTSSYGI